MMYYLTSEGLELLEGFADGIFGAGVPKKSPQMLRQQAQQQAKDKVLKTFKRPRQKPTFRERMKDAALNFKAGSRGYTSVSPKNTTKAERLGSLYGGLKQKVKGHAKGFVKGVSTPADKFSLGGREITSGEYAGNVTRTLGGKARRVLGRAAKAKRASDLATLKGARGTGEIIGAGTVYARIGTLIGEKEEALPTPKEIARKKIVAIRTEAGYTGEEAQPLSMRGKDTSKKSVETKEAEIKTREADAKAEGEDTTGGEISQSQSRIRATQLGSKKKTRIVPPR